MSPRHQHRGTIAHDRVTVIMSLSRHHRGTTAPSPSPCHRHHVTSTTAPSPSPCHHVTGTITFATALAPCHCVTIPVSPAPCHSHNVTVLPALCHRHRGTVTITMSRRHHHRHHHRCRVTVSPSPSASSRHPRYVTVSPSPSPWHEPQAKSSPQRSRGVRGLHPRVPTRVTATASMVPARAWGPVLTRTRYTAMAAPGGATKVGGGPFVGAATPRPRPRAPVTCPPRPSLPAAAAAGGGGRRGASGFAMDPEFDDVVSVEDLMALERRFAEQRREGSVSRRCQFEYAWGLVRSPYGNDVARGVALLQELMPKGTKEEQRDYTFYLALGNYRLKEYERALAHVERLLGAEPHNSQGLRLQRLIRQRMRRDGLLGAAIVGGVALGVAGLLGLAISRARH